MTGYPATPTRFVHEVGWRTDIVFWWDAAGSCGEHSSHIIRHDWTQGEGPKPDFKQAIVGYHDWYPEVGTKCESCDATWPGLDAVADPETVKHSAGMHPIYDTASGRLEPGCMWWNTYMPHEGTECKFNDWANCDGRHLMVQLPNGIGWDVDARANNCTHKVRDTPCPENEETGEHSNTCLCRTHRCWVRTGNPETEAVTAGKGGPTCQAGAGSILAGDYHGFLQNGMLTAG